MNKFEEYNSCIKFLFGLERIGIKYSLKNIRTLLNSVGNPQNNLKTIHIAGTNGKGSVASITNSILIEYKFNCGLYTSPHIKDFRERILVNGRFIDKSYVIDFTNEIFKLIEKISPSFFEVTTALAFKYFSDKKVDFAIIEAGLGGRLDSTNILKPILTVITGISIDHTEYLGNTIQRISEEKGGIIKRNTPVILGKLNKHAYKVLTKIAKKRNAEIIDSTQGNKIIIKQKFENGFYFDLKMNNFKLDNTFFPFIGDFQKINLLTAFSTINKLFNICNLKFCEKQIVNGLKKLKRNSRFYGRFEKISENPKIVIDVSHNLEGIKNIKNNLKYFNFNRLFIIFAMMSDKNYRACIKELEKLNSKIIITKPSYKRAIDPNEMIKNVKDLHNFRIINNPKDAFEYANKSIKRGDMILVTGSFFLISDILKVFKNKYNYS